MKNQDPGKENQERGGALNPLDDINRLTRMVLAVKTKLAEAEIVKYTVEEEAGISAK